MEEIQAFYRDILKISDAELLDVLTTYSKIQNVPKGAIVQNIGDRNTQVCFLKQGLLRGYFFDFNGRDMTDCFGFVPGTPVVSCTDLTLPATLCIEALEDSSFVVVPIEIVGSLLQSNLQAMKLYNQMLQWALEMHRSSKVMLAQYTATERYLWFLDKFPGLIDRVNHRHIASFLGMTPVSLSRIRRAIREKTLDSPNIAAARSKKKTIHTASRAEKNSRV